jgi:hypothetical protein
MFFDHLVQGKSTAVYVTQPGVPDRITIVEMHFMYSRLHARWYLSAAERSMYNLHSSPRVFAAQLVMQSKFPAVRDQCPIEIIHWSGHA